MAALWNGDRRRGVGRSGGGDITHYSLPLPRHANISGSQMQADLPVCVHP